MGKNCKFIALLGAVSALIVSSMAFADFQGPNVLKIRRNNSVGNLENKLPKAGSTPVQTPAPKRNWKIVVPPWQTINGISKDNGQDGGVNSGGDSKSKDPNSFANSLKDLVEKNADAFNKRRRDSGTKNGSGKNGSGGDQPVAQQEVGNSPPPDEVGERGGEPPGGGGIGPGDGGDTESEEVDRTYWIPYCFIVPPGMPLEQINAGVKGVVDSYGACDIAVEPYVFRVNYIPGSGPDLVNDMAKKVCPLNDVFKVSGAGVQTLVPSDTMSDEMCRSFDKGVPTTQVGGCSELGNGNSSGGIPSSYTQGGKQSYGAAGQSGVPAASMVDQAAWGSPGVWCHETGHSIGMPGRGGDNLVNQGEGEPPDAGLGLEKIKRTGGANSSLMCKEPSHLAAEGAGMGSCSFTSFGCLSLQGGSNVNDGRHKWDKKRNIYYYDRPSDPPPWDLMRGQSFFDYTDPPSDPPIQKPKKKEPPITREELVYNEDATKADGRRGGDVPGAGPGGGHKKKNNVSDPASGADQLINSIRGGGNKNGGTQKGLSDEEEDPLPVAGAQNSGEGGSSSLVYDESAKKGDGANSASDPSSSSSGSSSSSSSTTFGGGSGSGSGSLTYNEGASKNGAAGPGGNNGRNPASDANANTKGVIQGANEFASSLDPDFFNKVNKAEERRKRVKGATLRKNRR